MAFWDCKVRGFPAWRPFDAGTSRKGTILERPRSPRHRSLGASDDAHTQAQDDCMWPLAGCRQSDGAIGPLLPSGNGLGGCDLRSQARWRSTRRWARPEHFGRIPLRLGRFHLSAQRRLSKLRRGRPVRAFGPRPKRPRAGRRKVARSASEKARLDAAIWISRITVSCLGHEHLRTQDMRGSVTEQDDLSTLGRNAPMLMSV